MSAAASALGALKKFSQKTSSVDVSTTIFSLQRFTCAFLLCCSALTTCRQFFGDNIHCMLGHSDVPGAVFESYCFMQGTYSLPHLHPDNSSTLQHHHAHPGVSTGQHGASAAEDGTMYHNYYQWVCLLLVLQACICYVPWALWKQTERGRVGKLVANLSKDPLTEVPLADQVAGLASFLSSHPRWYNSCARNLLALQFLCLVLTVIQLFLMDFILGNQFLHHFGSHIVNLEQLGRGLEKVFPLVVMCSMSYFGPSGEPTMVSGMCTLPINIVNEKIYLVLWVWYITVVVLTIPLFLAQLALRLASHPRQLMLQSSSRHAPPGVYIRRLIRRSSYGDFVLLQFLAKNMDSSQFDALLSKLCESETFPSPSSQTQTSSPLDTYSSGDRMFGKYDSSRRLTSRKV